jgi:hypothetical protein
MTGNAKAELLRIILDADNPIFPQEVNHLAPLHLNRPERLLEKGQDHTTVCAPCPNSQECIDNQNNYVVKLMI